VNAARSRRKSVIVGSLFRYVSNLFYICSYVNRHSYRIWTVGTQRHKLAEREGDEWMKRWVATMIAAACLPAATLAAGFPADRIIAAASGDWNGDGAQDLAIIARPADDSIEDNGLYLYFANPDENRLSLALALPESVWGNLTLYGEEPELTALPNGSFTLLTKNEAVGRERWRQTLTIAYRNNDFIVAGYTF
jgi:hypothetical protein